MKNIPNILSSMRILLIPIFTWLALNEYSEWAAFVLVISGFTDMLDGYLARKYDWITPLGKILDPIADKLTQISVYFILISKLRWLWLLFSIMILKEFLMLVLSFELMRRGVKIQGAKWFGKLTTIVFYITMAILLFFPDLPEGMQTALVCCTLLCVIISAIMYTPEYIRYKKDSRKLFKP